MRMWTDYVCIISSKGVVLLLNSQVALWEWCYPEYWMESGYKHGDNQYPWIQVWVGQCSGTDTQ
jgi:hypothetical protein